MRSSARILTPPLRWVLFSPILQIGNWRLREDLASSVSLSKVMPLEEEWVVDGTQALARLVPALGHSLPSPPSKENTSLGPHLVPYRLAPHCPQPPGVPISWVEEPVDPTVGWAQISALEYEGWSIYYLQSLFTSKTPATLIAGWNVTWLRPMIAVHSTSISLCIKSAYFFYQFIN